MKNMYFSHVIIALKVNQKVIENFILLRVRKFLNLHTLVINRLSFAIELIIFQALTISVK